ncbi:MAG: hypothetical protein GY841_23900 [FCB group bacterium]|nr:hypothetical protein [FCB group bacterium]
MIMDEGVMIRVLARTTFLGLAMNILAPIIYIVLAVFLSGESAALGGGLKLPNQGYLQTLFYVFLAIAVVGLLATWYLKRNLPWGVITAGGRTTEERFESGAQKIAIIIFAINDIYAVMGVVLMLMGAGFEVMMIFVALNFVGYQLFRPRRTFLENVWERIEKGVSGTAS